MDRLKKEVEQRMTAITYIFLILASIFVNQNLTSNYLDIRP